MAEENDGHLVYRGDWNHEDELQRFKEERDMDHYGDRMEDVDRDMEMEAENF